MGRMMNAVRRAIVNSALHKESIASIPVATFSTDVVAPFKSIFADITAVQAGTGDPSLDNIRPIHGQTELMLWDDPAYGGLVTWNQLCGTGGSSGTGGGVTYTNNSDGTWTLTGSGTRTNRKQIASPSIPGEHIIYMRHGAKVAGSGSTFYVCSSYNGSHLNAASPINGYFSKLDSYGANQFSIRTFSGFTAPEGGLVLCPQLFDLTAMFGEEKAEEIYAMEGGRDYFLDLFPKHYYAYDNSGEKKTVSEVNGNPYTSLTISWQTEVGTVHGGTIDVLNGVLTVTHGNIASYNGETINEPWLSSMDVYSAGATPTAGAQVVYPLTTPVEYTLSANEIVPFLGNNNVWANTGNVSVEYWKH